jgi:4-hydroxybutyryl-CoA dehydratase/vinylacetyl-CoA-Delta-isomerase
MTAEQYKESLRNLKPNIWKFGELIEDITSSPHTKYTVEGASMIYALASDPEYSELFTTESALDGEKINRYVSLMRCPKDAADNVKIKRIMFRKTGTCTGCRCVGWSGLNAWWATTHDMDKELGTDYHTRVREWLSHVQKNDLALIGAMTDAKGDRTKPPSEQDDLDMNLRVVEKRSDGIVVRGAKTMIAGAAVCHEICVMPGSAYREPDQDFAISFAIPKDADGITIIEARTPSDRRKEEEGFDKSVECGGISQGYIFFDDVFVPNDRIFMCGEWKYTLPLVMRFIAFERSTMAGCVAGQGDLKMAAAMLVAKSNGIELKRFRDKLVDMAIQNETLFGVGYAAAMMSKPHESGVWFPDPLLSNVSKVHIASIPYQTNVLCQDITGGIGETGCVPSYADLKNPTVGPLVKKYMKAASEAEPRMKAARLAEFCTIGLGVPGCLNGGGSPAAARMPIFSQINIDELLDIGRTLAGIEEGEIT